MARTSSARFAFKEGRYDQAISWYEREKPEERDRLLHQLDYATILNGAGRAAQSRLAFDAAEEQMFGLEGARPLAQTAAVLANDNALPYQARPFEKTLIQLYQILNDLAQGETAPALIEVRQINTRYADQFKAATPPDQANAFVKFVSAKVWEAAGKVNDAYIDYKWLAKHGPEFPELSGELLRDCRRLGLREQCVSWQRRWPGAAPREPAANEGELVLLVGQGSAPLKESTEAQAELQIVPVPRYPPLPSIPIATVRIDRQEWPLTVFTDVAELAQRALADEMPAILARAVARLAVKEGAAVAVGKEVDKDLGIALGILVLATNRADLRSWTTLPRSFQGRSIYLPEGTYPLTLKLPGSPTRQLDGVTIRAGQKTFVVTRIF